MLLDWMAFALGTLGTIFWAMGRFKIAVALLWLLSSLLWIAHAYRTNQAPLLSRDLLSVFLYIAALVNMYKSRKFDPAPPISLNDEDRT